MTCVLCGEKTLEQLWTNLEKPSARHATQPLDVCICPSCGLVSLDISRIDPAAVQSYYETSNTFERPGPLPDGHKAMRQGQVSWALGHLPAGHGARKALDIGCGAGYVLNLLKQAGFDVMGTDLSPAMIANLRETYQIRGVQGPFSPELVGETFDFISSTCVLEHILDPRRAVEDMVGVLNPGGFLFLEVPDAEFPRWDVIVDHLAFDHVWHFTERTLGRLMEDCGLEILAVHHEDNPPDSGNPEPTVRLLGVKREGAFPRRYEASDYAHEKKVLADYKAKHKTYLEGFQAVIDGIAAKAAGGAAAIYCGGEHTATLLARFDLSKLDIRCIFDNDPAVTGKSLGGFAIRHGSEAGQGDIRHYLLSTTNHEKAIHAELKRRDPSCRVYGLYSQLD